jgi:PhnB protein
VSRVCTYLNFAGNTEEAFGRYAEIFGTSITSLTRFSDMGAPVGEDEQSLVMNAQLPILSGHVIMATDMLASMGHELRVGNNTTIVLETDTRDQADHFFTSLREGGDPDQQQGMADMPWGAYWGTCLDAYGIRWMISHTPN